MIVKLPSFYRHCLRLIVVLLFDIFPLFVFILGVLRTNLRKIKYGDIHEHAHNNHHPRLSIRQSALANFIPSAVVRVRHPWRPSFYIFCTDYACDAIFFLFSSFLPFSLFFMAPVVTTTRK